MAYPEYALWKAYYLIEPWGWENDEFLFAQLMSQIYNVNVSKRSKMKKPSVWMRDMPAIILRTLRNYRLDLESASEDEVDLETPQGREIATEKVIASIKKIFGNRVVDKRNEKK